MGRRIRNATDLGIDLDRIAARTPREPEFLLLTGCQPWERWLADSAEEGRCPCPVCGHAPRRNELCLMCSACGLEGEILSGRVALPGLPVDSAADPTYSSTGTIYDPPEDGLAGGVGVVDDAGRAG